MSEEYEIEYSRHCGPLSRDGCSVQVEIYRGRGETGKSWILEIVDDASGDSIIWDEQFETDQAAYDQLMKETEERGLAKVIEDSEEVQLPDFGD